MKAEVRVSAKERAGSSYSAVGRALPCIKAVQDGAGSAGTQKHGGFLILRKTRTGLE
jgi:hypothetical protein